MSKKLIIIAAVVVLGGGGATVFFLTRGGGEQAAAQTQAPASKPGIVDMDTFLANANDPGGERYVKLKLQLTVMPQTLATEIDEDVVLQAKMRDRVLTLLTAKTIDELIGPIGKEGFRRELKAALGPLLPRGEIQDVLFSEFVIQ